MGVSGIGYGGFNPYSGKDYPSIPYMAQNAVQSTATTAAGAAAGSAGAAPAGAGGAGGVAGPDREAARQAAAAGAAQAGVPAGSVEKAEKTFGTTDLKALKRMGAVECQTCKNRQYQDGSDDPGVSFKSPGHIDPSSSASVVMSHEQEHVANEQANAAAEGRRVVSQSVRLFTAVCPECGRVYVSGGETTTVTAADNSDKNQNKAASPYKSNGNAAGKLFDRTV